MSKPKIFEKVDNAGGVFVATKDTTTYQEIKDAYDSGKDVIVPYNGAIYELITIPTGSNTLYFHQRQFNNNGYATTQCFYMSLNTTNSWSNLVKASPPTVAGPLSGNGMVDISSNIGYYRPIRLSTEEPTASNGNIGDIWIQYEGE